MDYEALKSGMQQLIPFNNHLKLEYTDIGPGTSTVLLPEDDALKNHVGSQHAGALFTAGEAASGGAFAGAFAEHMAGITPLAKSAQISYVKIAKGPITADATFSEDLEPLLGRLDADGKVEFPVTVELTDSDRNKVAEMTVQWYVRKN